MIWNYTVTVCGLASPRATAPNTTVGVKPRAARGSTLHPTADRQCSKKRAIRRRQIHTNVTPRRYGFTASGPPRVCRVAVWGPIDSWGTRMKCNALLTCCAAAFAVVTTSAGADDFPTRTPIKHLVVIFNENISFDHYFGTYPHAKNTDGTTFTASSRTPKSINTLETPLDTSNRFQPLVGLNLLTNNPNLNPANGAGGSNPFRLAPSQAGTSDQ